MNKTFILFYFFVLVPVLLDICVVSNIIGHNIFKHTKVLNIFLNIGIAL